MNKSKSLVGMAAILATLLLTTLSVKYFHRPGQMDVLTAQAMDMSAMRPPVGAAPVSIGAVRAGSLGDVVTYTGTVVAYNEQIIAPRVTGTVEQLPVYPGDNVSAGELVAQLDSAEIGAQATQADAVADQATDAANVALLTHHLHHRAALDQAQATDQAAQEAVNEARSEEQADESSVSDAIAGVASAQASVAYWATEIPREKKLADAGAVSQQEYASELSQSVAAEALVDQAKAKVDEARHTEESAQAKVAEAVRNVAAADASTKMAEADLAVQAGDIQETEAGADAAKAAATAANIIVGYTQVTSPAAGMVTERPVAPGTLVQPGQELLKIEEIDRVRLQANVAVEDLAGISVGSPVTIEFADGITTRQQSTIVTAVFPSANDETRTAVVETVIPNPQHKFLPGAYVTMQFHKKPTQTGLLVASSAIVTFGGESYVWAATGGESNAADYYVCSVCHMHYTPKKAAELHYHDPMDGGVLILHSSAATPSGPMTVQRVQVTPIASDGTSTELSSGVLQSGAYVVTEGIAGLTDGSRVISTAWTAQGPVTLPSAVAASQGETVYRCEKCGMTYSAADAKKNNYIDPMDGGKLQAQAVPVPLSRNGIGGG